MSVQNPSFQEVLEYLTRKFNEDIAQEALARYLAKFPEVCHGMGYFYVCARNVKYQLARDEAKHRVQPWADPYAAESAPVPQQECPQDVLVELKEAVAKCSEELLLYALETAIVPLSTRPGERHPANRPAAKSSRWRERQMLFEFFTAQQRVPKGRTNPVKRTSYPSR